ncbi:hypothetical protein OT109_09865 [Phycisphaeraceae bacterium D3-23]
MENHNDDIKIVTLALLNSEVEAKLLSDALNLEGIHSEVAGILTGSFRAEAPGRVKVLVRKADLARAKELFDDYTHSKENIDWSQVDLSGGEDGAEKNEEADDNTPTS